jgi:hypothetical protein
MITAASSGMALYVSDDDEGVPAGGLEGVEEVAADLDLVRGGLVARGDPQSVEVG